MSDCADPMKLPAVDMHGHVGVLAGLSATEVRLFDVPVEEILERARACDIALTCVSDIGAFSPEPRPTDVVAANQRALEAAERHPELRFYAVLNPQDNASWNQVEALLDHPRCSGVKLHPRWNHWSLDDYGERVFAFLNERGALVSTHTGNPGCEPERFIPFANKYADVRLILAHLGHDEVDDTRDRQIKAIEASTQGNVWVDTSSSKSVTSRLIEHAVERIGAERIVFGTDTPLYFSPMQKARIAYAPISEEAKRKILRNNAHSLLELPPEGPAHDSP